MKICNCDRCDALVLNINVLDVCQTLERECTVEGFARYLRTKEPNAFYGFENGRGGKNKQVRRWLLLVLVLMMMNFVKIRIGVGD